MKFSLSPIHLAAATSLFVSLTVFAANQPSAKLFNGKDLSGWTASGSQGSEWKVGKAALDPADARKLAVVGEGTELIACEKAPNLTSEATFGDCQLELEFMVSKGSNSGIKMMKIYEIQIFDSYGKAVPSDTDCGAVYKESPPKVNAAKPAGEWQKLVIDFQAPRFDAEGKKTANAKFVKVLLNGKVIQENFEVAHGTNVGRNAKEYPTGSIFIQGDHGPVAFRNMVVTPRK